MWFKNLPKLNRDISKIIIIDPFIDTEIFHFLTCFENTDITFTVMTNTSARKSSEVKEELLASAKNLEKLKKFKFELIDAKTSSNRQLMHDRYLFLLSKQGYLRGFNLSNSIQIERRDFSLLITEIPLDILPPVTEFVEEIRKKSVVLYPNEKEEEYTQEKECTQEKEKECTQEKPDDISQEEILSKLTANPKRWIDICSNAHSNNTTKENLRQAIDDFSTTMWDTICEEIYKLPEPEVSLDQEKFLGQFFQEDINIFDSVWRIHSRGWLDNIAPVFKISFGLAASEPKIFMAILSKLDKHSKKKSLLLYEFINKLDKKLTIDENLYPEYLKLNNYFLNCVVAQSIFQKFLDGKFSFEQAVNFLEELSNELFLLILSKWIFCLKIKNQESQINEACTKMIEVWPSKIEEQTIKDIFRYCAGKYYQEAYFVYESLFKNLIECEKISGQMFFDFIKNLTLKVLDDNIFMGYEIGLFGILAELITDYQDNDFMDKLEKKERKSYEIINQDFPLSINYNSFRDANNVLHRLLVLCIVTEKHTPSNTCFQELKDDIINKLKSKNLFLEVDDSILKQVLQKLETENS